MVKIITVLVPIQWGRKQIERKKGGGGGARLIKNIDKQKKKKVFGNGYV